MKKIFSISLLIAFMALHAQQAANRFFYELTYKPKKDSVQLDKVMSVLDIVPGKSLFRDYTMIAQDSILKAKVEIMQKNKEFKDLSKEMKMPKFSYKITKTYPDMKISYSEGMLNGNSALQLSYDEVENFNWKISSEKQKISNYNTQKATTEFGGRTWVAWFATDLPFQDGPYKFYGLPGLIVKISDTENNYSWELKGNKKVSDFEEVTSLEKMSPGGVGSVVNVNREKFEKTFSDYKKDPFSSFRSQLTPELLSRKMPGSENTIGEMVKQQEKRIKDFYGATDNPVELSVRGKNK